MCIVEKRLYNLSRPINSKGDLIMPIKYKVDILAALKNAGYNSTRIRKDKIMGQATLQQLRNNELVSWKTIETLCKLLDCQPGDIIEYTEEI